MAERSGPYHDGAFKYSNQDADAYGSLEISGTTYEIGFDALAEMLGDLTGMTWLDFGAGAGRSSLFLHNLFAALVFGVDHNLSMVGRANSGHPPGVGYAVIDRIIPLANESVDGAISCNVYVEMPSRRDLEIACAEIYRVLRHGSWFFVMSTNPLAMGHEFKSFSYPCPVEGISSGNRVLCVIKTPMGVVEVDDFYWTRDDYEAVLRGAGFVVRETLTPTSSSSIFGTTDESIVGPFIILACLKE